MPRAKRRSSRPTAARSRVRCASPGKVEPVFIDDIADMPQAIIENARDGDVVIVMGAGSIGNVPAQVVERIEAIVVKYTLEGKDRMNGIDVKTLGKVAVLMGGTSAEREVSLHVGQRRADGAAIARRRRARVRSGAARSHRPQARRLYALLHRAAWPSRRRRYRARRARTAAHPVHRLGRAGERDRDRQGDDQAAVARRGLADTALRRARRGRVSARCACAACPICSACR